VLGFLVVLTCWDTLDLVVGGAHVHEQKGVVTLVVADGFVVVVVVAAVADDGKEMVLTFVTV
jgi:hypothetical protein